MSTTLNGLPVRRTSHLINPDTRFCGLIYASPKKGKTTLCATFHKWCQEQYGKPGLFIATESSEGGGTTSVQDYDVPYVQPANLDQLKGIIRALTTDTEYAAVFLDNATDMSKSLVQPYALKFPSREKVATRDAGVPERSDYQTMGEQVRIVMNSLIDLTKLPDVSKRKHVIVTSLRKEKRSSAGDLEMIGPDLPGHMADAAAAMFEFVATVETKTAIIRNEAGQNVRQKNRVLITSDSDTRLAGDRYKVFPAEAPCDFVELMNNYWIPKTKHD